MRSAKIAPALRCYLCGEGGADTKEHFVPRCFYPNKRLPPDHPKTLLAHAACNKASALDEEYVFVSMATSRPPGLDPNAGSQEIFERAKRSLTRPAAAAFGQRFLSNLTPLPSGGAIQKLETQRLCRVLAKVCKGIAWKDGDVFLPSTTRWWTSTARLEDMLLWPAGHLFDVPDVVTGRWQDVPDRGVTMWALCFYGTKTFFVSAIRHDDEPTFLEGEPDRFDWPPP